jgi:hypothetical protein
VGLGLSHCVPVSGARPRLRAAAGCADCATGVSAAASAAAEHLYRPSSLLSCQRVRVPGAALPKAFRESVLEAPCVHQVFAERTGGARVGRDDGDRRADTADGCGFERGGQLPCLADGTYGRPAAHRQNSCRRQAQNAVAVTDGGHIDIGCAPQASVNVLAARDLDRSEEPG